MNGHQHETTAVHGELIDEPTDIGDLWRDDMVGFALGSETSGSILTPSAYCGVTGLRPTYGLVSRRGAMALMWMGT